MNRPTGFTMCHMGWRIEWPERIKGRLKGLCDTDAQLIQVATRFDLATQQHVLFHEMNHAAWYSSGMTPRLVKKHFEEDVVGALSGPMIEGLRCPGIMEFLTLDT